MEEVINKIIIHQNILKITPTCQSVFLYNTKNISPNEAAQIYNLDYDNESNAYLQEKMPTDFTNSQILMIDITAIFLDNKLENSNKINKVLKKRKTEIKAGNIIILFTKLTHPSLPENLITSDKLQKIQESMHKEIRNYCLFADFIFTENPFSQEIRKLRTDKPTIRVASPFNIDKSHITLFTDQYASEKLFSTDKLILDIKTTKIGTPINTLLKNVLNTKVPTAPKPNTQYTQPVTSDDSESCSQNLSSSSSSTKKKHSRRSTYLNRATMFPEIPIVRISELSDKNNISSDSTSTTPNSSSTTVDTDTSQEMSLSPK